MPRRYQRNGRYRNGNGNSNGTVFNAGTAINVFTIPVITTGFILIGWYFTTNATMQQQNKDIGALQQTREADKKEFGLKFDEMNKSLSLLNTHAALQDQEAKMMNDTLKEIRDQLTPSAHK